MQQSALWYSHLLLNTSAQNEDGVCQFVGQYAPQIGYHSSVILESFIMMLTYPSVFTENLVKISPCTLVETSQFSNVSILTMCAPNYPWKWATNLRGYWTKVHEIFTRHKGIIGGINATIHIAILPSVVEHQHTEWRRGVNFHQNARLP